MSTRATYKFSPASGQHRHEPTTTIYVHHDGYEKGAALYFYLTLIHPSKGCLATQFIRANDGAELTLSHDIHGDTEYRYNVSGHGPDATLTVQKRDFSAEQWRGVYVGQLASFIDQHHGLIENYSAFRAVKSQYDRTSWLNLDTARIALDGRSGPLYHLRIWNKSTANGVSSRTSGNWTSCAESARLILAAFPELWTDEASELLGDVAPVPVVIDASSKVYRMEECKGDAWKEFVEKMRSGTVVECDEEMTYYWLEVLPPVSMGQVVTLDGVKVRTWFLFAEGAEKCVAFWKRGERFFCQLTDILNPHA